MSGEFLSLISGQHKSSDVEHVWHWVSHVRHHALIHGMKLMFHHKTKGALDFGPYNSLFLDKNSSIFKDSISAQI